MKKIDYGFKISYPGQNKRDMNPTPEQKKLGDMSRKIEEMREKKQEVVKEVWE